MNYLKLFEEFAQEVLYRELDYDEHDNQMSEADEVPYRTKEPFTRVEFDKIKKILEKYGIFDESLDFEKTLKKWSMHKFNDGKGGNFKDPDGCRIVVNVTKYRRVFNEIQHLDISKLQDDYYYVGLDTYCYTSWLCDTLEGFEQLIKAHCVKEPTRFNVMKHKVKKFLNSDLEDLLSSKSD